MFWSRVLQCSFFFFFNPLKYCFVGWRKFFPICDQSVYFLWQIPRNTTQSVWTTNNKYFIGITKKFLLSNVQQFGYNDNLSLEESSLKNGNFVFYQKKAWIKWAEPRDVLKMPSRIFVHQPLLYLLTPCLLLH